MDGIKRALMTGSTAIFVSTSFSSTDYSPDPVNATIFGNATGANATTESDTTTLSETTPVLLPTLIASTEQLIIFSSVIIGVLGFFILLAVVGWAADQTGYFGDPITESIRRLEQKNKTSGPTFRECPKVAFRTDDPNIPGWLKHQYATENMGGDNYAYEAVDEPIRVQHEAAGHFEQIQSEIEEELSDPEYDDIGPDLTSTRAEIHNVKPSLIAARERRSRRQNAAAAVAEDAYETQIPTQSNGGPGIHSPEPGNNAYELTVDDGGEEQYGGSLYSNSSMIPPAIPPRK